MVKKAAGRLDEHDITLEVAPLPVTESETSVLPVIEANVEAEVEAPSDEGIEDPQDIKLLMLKIAALEEKFVKLQAELNTLVNKKKEKKESKGNKVKCKCKGKKVDIAKCKCRSKKSEQ